MQKVVGSNPISRLIASVLWILATTPAWAQEGGSRGYDAAVPRSHQLELALARGHRYRYSLFSNVSEYACRG